MQRGDVVANRFVVERLAGRGGMGSVYRALDRVTGAPIALKILEAGSVMLEDRFFSEARALAAISHPAVVRYVAQGAETTSLWLAMEWLEGEDLGVKLSRGRLDLREALAIAIRTAEGIAAAHEAGLIHRDLKPANLFLVGGEARALKVLDFGVARLPSRTKPITKTGQMVGTVGYMAPEQIAGERDVDQRVDVFALGCVLFECLTGRPPFAADSIIAVIAKVLREEAPKPSELEPRVGPELDALVLSMLAKQRSARPASIAEVAAKLRAIASEVAGAEPAAPLPQRTSVTGREQRLVSAILVAPPTPAESTAAVASRVAPSFGADVSELGEGACLLVVSSSGSAKDQAARAASCALALRLELPEAAIALGTGLAEPTCGLPVGPAIDRAAALLDAALGARGIPVDDVTAALLDDRYDVVVEEGRHTLHREARIARSAPPAPRGTPFVGREKEMAIIEAVLAESLGEPVARAVVVTGQAGAGKSRLRRELVARTAGRDGVRFVVARADVVGSGSALSLVRQIVERLALVSESDDREMKAQRLAKYVDGRFDEAGRRGAPERVHWKEFLGELVGAAPSDAPSPELATARNEPRALAEWLRRTFVDVVTDEARRAPLAIVLEDLHWGDEATVEFLGDALRRAADLPLFVLALARTEVWEVLPRLREAFEPHEVRLAGLTPRAAQKLAEAALGQAATPDRVARIVARSEGNPFFLEELARSATDGRTDTSETVLAVVQSRIQRLDTEARRLLRAASIFGRVFKRPGVAHLLGVPSDAADLDAILTYLDERELIERAAVQDLSTDAAYAFCHDLVRDAAYATLPDADRARAHVLAAEWIEREGNEDASLLAEHYELGDQPARAVDWLVRAVEQAQNAGSYERVIALVGRAAKFSPSGPKLGTLRGAEALARAWRHDWQGSFAASSEALALLSAGQTPWFRAAAVHFFGAVSTGHGAVVADLTKAVLARARGAEATGPYGFAAFVTVNALSLIGAREAAETLLTELDARGATPSTDFGFVAWRALSRVHFAITVQGSPGIALRELSTAARFAPGAADRVVEQITAFYRAVAIHDCGDAAGALSAARAILATPGIDSVPYLRTWSTHLTGRGYLVLGRYSEAIEMARVVMASEDELLVQRARSLAAQAHFAAGETARASELCDAILAGTFSPQDVAVALSVSARIASLEGRPSDAVALSERAVALLESQGASSTTTSMVRHAHVDALLASGALEPARGALTYARSRIHDIGRGIGDAALARAWLALPDNARVLDLATAHLDGRA